MRIALLIHAMALFLSSVSFANIKTLTPKSDEIVEIKTALGIATIIQIPETIQSAIMGDQSAYRIEYADRAVTIKPLRNSAKTNLYLFTKEKRYNLRLYVVPQNQAYYIVYIKKLDMGAGPRWVSNGKIVANADMSMKLNRTGTTQDGVLLLDVLVTAKKPVKLQASDFWLWQGHDSKVIQSLFLSCDDLKKDQTALVGISVKRAELKNQSLILEMKSSPVALKIEIPREALWK